MQKRCIDILASSGVSFGTSGARGLVDQLTDEVCAAFTIAFLEVMQQRAKIQKVAIGMDRRPSSPRIVAACTAASKALGIDVIDYGVLPTPALALQAAADSMPAIMVTGSHIPFDRNGIKFYSLEGEITKHEENSILNNETKMPKLGESKRQIESGVAQQRYIDRYAGWFDGMPLTGFRIGLYQHSAAGRDINVTVLKQLGAEVIELDRSEEFVPVDTEAVTEIDRKNGLSWAKEYNLDAIITTDGDGDRPLIADETGVWLRGDMLGLLCARELNIQAVAVPVSCNTAIEKSGLFSEVRRTKIGSPYVISEINELSRKYSSVAGFEANGGFILGSTLSDGNKVLKALTTRDALLPALTVLVTASQHKKSLSGLVAELPERYTSSDRLKEFPTDRSQRLITEWERNWASMQQALGIDKTISDVNTTDGLRITLDDGDIIHLRPSGNAPELRCYTESSSSLKADELTRSVLASSVFK
jgi:phosphomannomutase